MANPNPPIGYIIIGQIIDKNQQPIPGTTITSTLGDTAITGTDGNFSLTGEYTPGEMFKINIFSKNYTQKKINPFNLSKELKNQGRIGIITLKDSKADLRQSIDNQIAFTAVQMGIMKASKMNLEVAKQQAMNKIIVQIKTVLIPQVLTLIADFGIPNASDFIGQEFSSMNATCPINSGELNSIIRKKNNLTKALNNIMKFLKTVRVVVASIAGVVTALDIVINSITPVFLFFPISGFGAPNFGQPIKFIIEKIDKVVAKLRVVSNNTLVVIIILIEELQRVLNFLALLDTLIGGCALSVTSSGETLISQEQLSSDLLEATQKQSKQLSPVVTNVNGFEMDVIPVDNSSVDGLKRRKAIARNKAGVIMLEGEPSFSSNDQILIDELVYYIQTNDLKAD
jgi:hypothetical protein